MFEFARLVASFVEQLADAWSDLRAVELDARHHRLVRQRTVCVFQIEPGEAERLNRRRDLARDRLRRSDLQRAVWSGFALELRAGRGWPSALRADARHQFGVTGP